MGFFRAFKKLTDYIKRATHRPRLDVRVRLGDEVIEAYTAAEKRRDDFAPIWTKSSQWYLDYYAILGDRTSPIPEHVSNAVIGEGLGSALGVVTDAMSESLASDASGGNLRTVARRGYYWNDYSVDAVDWLGIEEEEALREEIPDLSRREHLLKSEHTYKSMMSASGVIFNGGQFAWSKKHLDLRAEQIAGRAEYGPLDKSHPHSNQKNIFDFIGVKKSGPTLPMTPDQLAFKVARLMYWLAGAGELGRNLGQFDSPSAQIKHFLSEMVTSYEVQEGKSGSIPAHWFATAISAGFESVEKFFRAEVRPVSRLGRAFELVMRVYAEKYKKEVAETEADTERGDQEAGFLKYLMDHDEFFSDWMWQEEVVTLLNDYRRERWESAHREYQAYMNDNSLPPVPDPETTIGRPASAELLAEIVSTQKSVMELTERINRIWWMEFEYPDPKPSRYYSDGTISRAMTRRFGTPNCWYENSLNYFASDFVPGGEWDYLIDHTVNDTLAPWETESEKELEKAEGGASNELLNDKVVFLKRRESEAESESTDCKLPGNQKNANQNTITSAGDRWSAFLDAHDGDIRPAYRYRPSQFKMKLPVDRNGAPLTDPELWDIKSMAPRVVVGSRSKLDFVVAIAEAGARMSELFHVSQNYGLPRDNLFAGALLSFTDPHLNGNSSDDFSGTVHGDLESPLLGGIEFALGKNFRYFPTMIGKIGALDRRLAESVNFGSGLITQKEIDLCNFRLARLSDAAHGDEYIIRDASQMTQVKNELMKAKGLSESEADRIIQKLHLQREQSSSTLSRRYCEDLQNQIRSWGPEDGLFTYEQEEREFVRPLIGNARAQAIGLFIHSPGTYLRRTGFGGLNLQQGAPAAILEKTTSPRASWNTFFDPALGRLTDGTTCARGAPGESLNPLTFLAKGSGFIQIKSDDGNHKYIRFQKKMTTHPGTRSSAFPRRVLHPILKFGHRSWTANPFDSRDGWGVEQQVLRQDYIPYTPNKTYHPPFFNAGSKEASAARTEENAWVAYQWGLNRHLCTEEESKKYSNIDEKEFEKHPNQTEDTELQVPDDLDEDCVTIADKRDDLGRKEAFDASGYIEEKNLFGGDIFSSFRAARLTVTKETDSSFRKTQWCRYTAYYHQWFTPYNFTLDSEMGECSHFVNTWHKQAKQGVNVLDDSLSQGSLESRRLELLQRFIDGKRAHPLMEGVIRVADSWHVHNNFYQTPVDPEGTFGDLSSTGNYAVAAIAAGLPKQAAVGGEYASSRGEGTMLPYKSLGKSEYYSFGTVTEACKENPSTESQSPIKPAYNGRFMLGVAPLQQPGGLELIAPWISGTSTPENMMSELIGWGGRAYKLLAAGRLCRDFTRGWAASKGEGKNIFQSRVYQPELDAFRVNKGDPGAVRDSREKLDYALDKLSVPGTTPVTKTSQAECGDVLADIILFQSWSRSKGEQSGAASSAQNTKRLKILKQHALLLCSESTLQSMESELKNAPLANAGPSQTKLNHLKIIK